MELIVPVTSDEKNFQYDTLFKYMDFPQFMAFITNQSMHFTRIDKFDEYFKEKEPGAVLKAFEKVTYGQYKLPDFSEECKKYYIACWTCTTHESYPLWEAYGKTAYSIAIKSSFGSIRKAIMDMNMNNPIVYSIQCGLICYFDKAIEQPNDSGMRFFFYKPKQFEAEKEFRFLIDGDTWATLNHNKLDDDDSKEISVSLKELIKCIYVSYHAEQWFFDLVKHISIQYNLTDEQNVDKFVKWSVLS